MPSKMWSEERGYGSGHPTGMRLGKRGEGFERPTGMWPGEREDGSGHPVGIRVGKKDAKGDTAPYRGVSECSLGRNNERDFAEGNAPESCRNERKVVLLQLQRGKWPLLRKKAQRVSRGKA